MKKLRFFDSLKFMLATVACMFAIMPAHAATLPAGYTELEYLESTGEQYVELSFGFDPTDMIQADFSVNIEEYSDKYMVAPKVWNSNHNKFAMGVHQGIYTIAYKDLTTGSTGLIPSKRNDGQIHKWIYGGYVFSIPELNTSRDVSDITFRTTTSNIRLFYGYQGGTKGKISYYKHVKANGTSVELIPARRDSDGVLGMYDLADANPSTAFHTNAGTGEFVAGPATPIKIATTKYNEQQFAPVKTDLSAAVNAVEYVVSNTMTQAQAIDQIANEKQTRPDEGCTAKYCLLVEDEDGTPHWYPIAGANGVAHNLPAGYTELQYIEFDGNQYMFLPTFSNAANIDVTVDVVHTDGDNEQILFANNGAVIQLLYTTNNSWRVWRTTKSNRLIAVAADDRHLITIKTTPTSCEYYVDNQKNTNVPEDFFNSTEFSGKRLGIGARILENTVGYFWKGKIYSFKAECNGVVCINMVPARNSSGEIGMLDLTDSNPATAFHTNAGTGTFTAGPDM